MNRRDFLKVGFAGLVGAMFPKLGAERLGIDMPIGDVLAKLAGGQQLNSGEIEQLRLWGNRQELQNAFVAGLQTGTSDINAGTVSSRELQPDALPTKFVSVGERAVQSIPNTTWTKVTIFEDALAWGTSLSTSGISEYFEWDYTNQRFKVLKHGRRFLLYAGVHWADNDTGARAITVDTYLEDETYNGSFWLDVRTAFWHATQRATRYPAYYEDDPDNDFYYTLSVYQSSGGALNIEVADFAVGVIE